MNTSKWQRLAVISLQTIGDGDGNSNPHIFVCIEKYNINNSPIYSKSWSFNKWNSIALYQNRNLTKLKTNLVDNYKVDQVFFISDQIDSGLIKRVSNNSHINIKPISSIEKIKYLIDGIQFRERIFTKFNQYHALFNFELNKMLIFKRSQYQFLDINFEEINQDILKEVEKLFSQTLSKEVVYYTPRTFSNCKNIGISEVDNIINQISQKARISTKEKVLLNQNSFLFIQKLPVFEDQFHQNKSFLFQNNIITELIKSLVDQDLIRKDYFKYQEILVNYFFIGVMLNVYSIKQCLISHTDYIDGYILKKKQEFNKTIIN